MKSEGLDGIEKFDSPGKGRGIRITKPFKVGELLFACPAFAYVLSVSERGYLCDFCFAKKEGLAKCGKCKKAFYCNAGCQKADWKLHKLECSSMCAYGDNWCPSETVRLVARILVSMKSNKDGERGASEKLLLMSDLEAHLDEMDNERREVNEMDVSPFTPASAPRNERLRDAYFFTCNCKECSSRAKDEQKLRLRKLSEAPPPEQVRTAHATSIMGVHQVYLFLPTLFLPLHPCVCLCVCVCVCLCVYMYFICVCVCVCLSLTQYTHPSELLQMCEMSLERMGAVFDDSNVYMLHMMYQAMGVCIYQGDWEQAARYGEKIISPFSALYPAYSLNVASMCIKLGRLYVGLDKLSLGIKYFKKAQSIMEVAMGKDHHSIGELKREMQQQK
ncbi:N-lysine methyltransferase SMYD2-A-like [Alosa alosa]|nr:N-lysine methyltransferase SMYD2-A-like [Alosa alosa]